MNLRRRFDEGLRAVAVVYIPIDNEDPPKAVPGPRVMGCQRDIPEQAEAHPPSAQCMVPGRTNGAKRAGCPPVQRHVDSVQHAAGSGGRCGPGSFADERVWIQAATAMLGEASNVVDVPRIMDERQLFGRGVPTLDVGQR